ncbi:preprotein translocase subunit SecA [Candidatus Giovannonibacteria bacterium RIFCSPLOWO2_12_FULL_44_25]|uniref:Protein translocase subunit SecA n=2 Tax=Candidatus Giovannoniibacteriota TaxID=1752738 RepID=A0A1F5W9Q8_9BACT|nr:MAG: Protein translocase subunit SecA [Candidatus Giovannonibacteria bacterium GW2011_GWA1_44_25]KKU29440.1 MAG: Protein translocase subunit SecA [Candidatus Giovannonibacteria bacterium GW2011_GWB1_46_20]OGF50429.1 MAG: preprotein translocase subunit SecA [Candidatus Giovannonibacteria bacterium GWA2_45_15]OGF59137.1 MAG: preprotein translocase subunit SecA [Candidatus Giovannonibacteria bacterium RIFCSPHIGHO2_01_45_12]OGF60182.1 MAG: preprotein translocase subunit SecA [Candidatus Giovanno
MSIFGKIFGDANEKVINEMRPVAEEINNLEKDFEKLSDGELKKKTEEFKAQIANGKSLDELLPEAFAAVREAAKRTLGQRHFDVQLMGGIALHRGEIAEMKTGEGKTLVATLPAYLNALTGKGVHIVTVNDYLSRRDAAWMGQIYDALGLSVGVLNHEASYLYDTNLAVAPPSSGLTAEDQIRDALGAFKIVHEFLRPCSRREAYTADIIYGTNNEYGFDYLRDNMVYSAQQMSQREHHFAIVDEVDSILIDEARTPLIISMPDAESAELYKVFSKIAPRLKENVDYNIDEKMKTALISEPGIEKVEQMLGVKDIYTERGMRFVHHLEQALRAQALFVRDRDYVVKSAAHGGGEVIIVDEFTGRLMPGRRWSDGLHQAIEAKEGVNVQQESRTLATITFQNYFRMYEKLAGMTGTAQTSAEEFHKVYKLEVVQIPTNKQMIRKDLQDKVFQTEKGKFQALVREIKERSQKGQPVLVGTVSIEKNEKLAAMLQREGIAHKILNAKNHEEEGAIIAQAGRFGAVTVATNMAGRGVDIILGGNPPSADEASRVREVGGLLVVGTERHEARRIDDQLRGRSGRQGDPGESHFFVSMEDDLMRIFASEKVKNLMGRFGIPEDEPIENKMVSGAIESAQGKIEGFNFDTRKHVLEYDDVMNKQRTAIYARRKKILFAESKEIEDEALKLLEDVLSKIVTAHTAGPENEWNRKEIFENLVSLVGGDGDSTSLRERVEKTESREGLTELAKNYAKDAFAKKKEGIAARLPDWQGFAGALRMVMLQAIDALWMEHLEAMEYMRSSVRLRAYGQKDPLVEYKNEGAKMFQQLEGHINTYIANLIFKITPATQPHNVSRQPNVKHPMSDKNSFGRHAERGNGQAQLGRNDPCPCGSGKKYKRCHGQ